MKISKLAKILLSTSLLLAQGLPASGIWEVHPHFSCGTYLVRGVLGLNGQGSFVLSVRKNTMSPYELVLLGGNTPSKLSHLNTLVTLRVYFPQPISNPQAPFVFLQNIQVPGLDESEEYRLLKTERCSDESRFHS